jgi:hypothetical protein
MEFNTPINLSPAGMGPFAAIFAFHVATALPVDLPPAPVGPTIAEAAAIDQLINDLGSSEFAIRDRAYRKLGEFEGKAYRLLLAAESQSADAEVRHRCGLLLPAARVADLNARIAAFLEDKSGQFAHDLPGLARYREITRGNPSATAYFAQILRDPGTQKLFLAAEANPDDIPSAVAARAVELQQRQGRTVAVPPPGLVVRPVNRPATVSANAASATEILGMLFVDSLTPADAQTRRMGIGPATFLYQQQLRTAVAGPAERGTGLDDSAKLARAILQHWFDSREDTYELNTAISYAGQFDMPDAVVRAATKQLTRKGAVAHMRGQAIASLAKFGKDKAVPTLESLLKDETQAGMRYEQETGENGQMINKQYPIQTRDIALAMLLHLDGVKPADYGMRTFAATESMKYQYTNHWFRTEDAREAAFKKFAEERAKKKSGPMSK